MTAPIRFTPGNSYRAAMLAARQRFGALEVANARKIAGAIDDWAKKIAAMTAALPAGDAGVAALQRSEMAFLKTSISMQKAITAAISEGRDVTFHELLGLWKSTGLQATQAAGVPNALLGGVKLPPVTLLGAMEQASGAGHWKTLLGGHVRNAAGEAQSIIRQGLLEGIGPEELAKRLRYYVQGAQPFHHLFEKVPGKNGGVATINLAKIPREQRRAAQLMNFNARRIAYTELANAKHEANLQHFIADPLIWAVKWHTSPDRGKTVLPDECDVLRDTDFYGLGPGVYPLNAVPPLPHPFDRCMTEPLTRPAAKAKEPKPTPGLQLDPMKANVAGFDTLTDAGKARVLGQVKAAVTFGQAGGWNQAAGQELAARIEEAMQAQRALVAALQPPLPVAAELAPPVPKSAMPGPGDGPKVSAGLSMPAANNAAAVREAAAVIDEIHSDGRLPTIPVEVKSLGPSVSGQYRYRVYGGQPDSIRVSTSRDRAKQALTFFHEVGHFLDHQAIAGRNAFASGRGAEVMAKWRKAVAETALVKRLRELSGPGISAKYRRYLLEVEEIWARSYAQWIATRAADPKYLEALEAMRAADTVYSAGQWEAEDFAPVAAAIDEMMEALGWRTSTAASARD